MPFKPTKKCKFGYVAKTARVLKFHHHILRVFLAYGSEQFFGQLKLHCIPYTPCHDNTKSCGIPIENSDNIALN